MTLAATTERAFETLIVDDLTRHRGWLVGDPARFNAEAALIPADLFAWLAATQPALWQHLADQHGADKRDALILTSLTQFLRDRGTLEVLRRGFKVHGQPVSVATFRPAHGLNPDLERDYRANRLVVTRQVRFDPSHPGHTVDLVFSLNGLPVATCELKNDLTRQTVDDAIQQYRDRDPRVPLFRFKERALVHFAVDTERVYTTTRLAGRDTRFLPFNRGHEGGAGNPPDPEGHRTAYLWERIWERDSFLDLLARFLHLSVDDEKKAEALLFPRYHQLDAVRALESVARREGPGHSYLVQHSAGSGKSNTIAWLAYRLATLHDKTDARVFDSVVVVTDRLVLDSQLQKTIAQFEHTRGFVETIDKTAQQLATALKTGARIVITTLQKFPFADLLGALPTGRRYAVIIDEAHSSQSGEAARVMKEVLAGGNTPAAAAVDAAADDDENEYDPEERIAEVMASRGRQPNLSFFAFTATPKPKTLEVFGQRGAGGKPEPFHIYTMQQAIEEKFILDVLRNYTTYQTFYRLVRAAEDDPKVPKSEATRALGRFMSLHPYNIEQRVAVMVEHFRESVAKQLGGQAKAMVVTSSRLHAVRYKLAFDRYLAEKKYGGIRVLVAFSGTVKDPDEPGREYTEAGMNGFAVTELPRQFDKPDARLLVAANKYQTGFDQPKLQTMYVDKRLDGVQAVQTLSRLNRTYPGKTETFVLDFVNEAEAIQAAFEPYFRQAILAEAADPAELYRLQHALGQHQVYWPVDIENFAKVFFKQRAKVSEKDHAEINRLLAPMVERFAALGEEQQEAFRADAERFVSLYGLLSQVMSFGDADLEKLHALLHHLTRKLPQDPRRAPLRIEGDVELESYRLAMTHRGSIKLGVADAPALPGFGDASTRAPVEDHTVRLSEIIDRLNERHGANLTESDRITVDGILKRQLARPEVVASAKANTIENFMLGVRGGLEDDVLEHRERSTSFADRFLNDDAFRADVERLLGELIYKQARVARANDGDGAGGAGGAPDVEALLEVSALRNRLEPKLRRVIKRTLMAHLGEHWVRPVIEALPSEVQKQLVGVDADKILNERVMLSNLVTVMVNGWDKYFKAFETGPAGMRKASMQVLLEYVNAHREDAHARDISETDAAALRVAVGALEKTLERYLAA